MGASLLGYDGIASRLEAFKKTIKEGEQFYFVKYDVMACYDSIPHEKLFSILIDKILPKEDFTVHKYDIIKKVHGKLQKTFKKYACPMSDFVGLSGFTAKRNFGSIVLVDKVLGASMDRRVIIKILYDHIFNNNVCLDGQMYCQKAGIPQGSILSALFCSFLYADLDHCHLAPFLNAPNSVRATVMKVLCHCLVIDAIY
jgi:telomerase reverse transcriptase